MLGSVLLAGVTLISGAIAAAEDSWIVDADYGDPAALARIGGSFPHLIVDQERRSLRAETDSAGIELMQAAGLDVRVDMVATATWRALYAPGQTLRSIPSFACYRTVEETRDSLDDMLVVHPQLASAEVIGPTWERLGNPDAGYEMRALRITNLETADADPQRPRMVMLGSIHAREYAPAELLTRMAEWLVTGYGNDAQATWLVDHVDFRFILHANPDGRKKAESGVLWRKNTNTSNEPGGICTAQQPSASYHAGIDLNRNFPYHWSSVSGGSSGSVCDATYRGPEAASEPETRNLIRYIAGTPDEKGVYRDGVLSDRKDDDALVGAPDDYAGLFFDIHSFGGLVLWPWGDVTSPSPNAAAFQTLGRRIAWFNQYRPQRAVQLYPTDGGTIDTFYGQLGAPSFVMEVGTTFFQDCATFQNTIFPANLAALKYAARAARAPYQLPGGPDVHAIGLSRSLVVAGEDVTLTATINDTRFRATTPAQPTFPVIAANAWVDTLPWQEGAAAIALQAADATFDNTVEQVTGTISTTQLEPGRHLILVQGFNAVNGAGTPDAVFLDVLAVGDRIFADAFDPLPER